MQGADGKTLMDRIKEGRTCKEHPGQELSFISAKDGKKKCAMCILKESAAGGSAIKDRYCLKHPGFEKLFYST